MNHGPELGLNSNQAWDLMPAMHSKLMDLIRHVLGQADHPGELARSLADGIRELTGAHGILLTQCGPAPDGSASRLLCLEPSQVRLRAEKGPELSMLVKAAHQLKTTAVWPAGAAAELSPALAALGFDLAVALPLQAGTFRVGSLVVLGLPDPGRLDEVRNLLEPLAGIAALVLRNAALHHEQEQIVAERIRDLRESEKRIASTRDELKRVLDLVPDMICTVKPDGRFQSANPAFVKTLGYAREELLAVSFFDLIHPDDREQTKLEVQRQLAAQPTACFENRYRCKDGSHRVLEWYAAPSIAGVLYATARDITERKRTEEKIREQAALLDQTNDAILVRTGDGVISYWNQGAENMFGWTAREIVGRNARETLFASADSARLEEIERQVLQEGHWLGEMRYVTKTGNDIIGQARATLLQNPAGAPQSFLLLITDLTEHKKLEAQFLRTQRLEALGTLASGIAHDLNNILAPIVMVAPLLREAQTPADMVEQLDLIEASVRRATDVARQLLAFGRGQGGERMPLHLKHLLRDLRHVILETFPRNISFASSEDPNLWPLVADPTQLHQILLNLCINARDAMPEGGKLCVTTTNFQADDHFASMVAGARPVAYVHLQVSDTGSGIRPEHLDKIFDPFFTTKDPGRGTGLGLATVQQVVASHGGLVQVHSQVDQGTTFDVFLPASPDAVDLAKPSAPPASPLDGQGQLILIVDDEEYIRRITQQTLLRHGYRTITAADGVEAVAIFARHQQETKAVVTDLMMPGLDGLGLVKVLNRMAPALPVLVSTGLGSDPAQNEKLVQLRQLGVGVCLTKPYTTHQLLAALQAVISPP